MKSETKEAIRIILNLSILMVLAVAVLFYGFKVVYPYLPSYQFLELK